MKYKGFWVKISSAENLQREDKHGNVVICEGYEIGIFSNESEDMVIDRFTAAVGYEILKKTTEEAEQFVKDCIDCEEKEYGRKVNNIR